MPTVRIDEVEPGAVLARPVEDSIGRVLINAGEVLTDQLILVLRKRGFVEVEVKPGESQLASSIMIGKPGSSGGNDDDAASLRAQLVARFASVPKGDQQMQLLRSAVEKVLMERLIARKGRRVS